MPVHIGLVGTGLIAEAHLHAFREVGADVVAISSSNGEKAGAFARRFGVPTSYAAYDELVGSPNVDAVILASPSAVHAGQATLAIENGRHVFVEIPLALSVDAAAAVVREASHADVALMVGHTQRHFTPIQMLRARLEAEQARVLHIIARTTIPRRENRSWDGRPRTWVDDLIWHHGGHVVDVVLWVIGDAVESVVAHGGIWAASDGSPMDVSISMRSATGILATVALSYTAARYEAEYVFIADRATYTVRDWHLSGDGDLLYSPHDSEEVQRQAMIVQAKEFVTAIEAGRRPHPNGEDVLPAMRVLDEVERQVLSAWSSPR